MDLKIKRMGNVDWMHLA